MVGSFGGCFLVTSASWYACPRVTPSPVIGAGLVDSLLTHGMPWRGRIATYDSRLQKDCGLCLVPSRLALPRIMSPPRPGGDQLPTCQAVLWRRPRR